MSEDATFKQAFVRLRSHTTGAWFVHPDLRPRLVADAEAAGTNLTETVVKILSGRYGVPYEPSGRRTRPLRESDKVLNVRLPAQLHRAIKNANDADVVDAIRADLCAHYGLAQPAAAAA